MGLYTYFNPYETLTLPQWLLRHTSTLPSEELAPPTNLTSPVAHWVRGSVDMYIHMTMGRVIMVGGARNVNTETK